MSYDLVEIAGRVQRLERDNRRLRLAAGCLVALVVAVPLVGAVLPAQVPEVIEAREFRVLDEQGMKRVDLVADGLRFYDEQGTYRVGLGVGGLDFFDEQGTVRAGLGEEDGLRFYDEQGTGRVGLGVGGLDFFDEQGTVRTGLGEARLNFADEQGTLRVTLGADSLGFVDEQEAIRLQLGRVTVINSSTKAETTYPAALVLFDEDGDVIERLPR